MKKIFKEYGGIIIVVIAIVALIGLVSALMQPGGVMEGAFSNITQSFVNKVDDLADGDIPAENLLESLSWTYGKSIQNDAGNTITYANGSLSSDIDVESGKSYVLNFNFSEMSSKALRIVYYDSDNNYISSKSIRNYYDEKTFVFTVPNDVNVVKAKLTFKVTSDSGSAEKLVPTTSIMYSVDELQNNGYKLAGKTILNFGDSIAFGSVDNCYSYCYQVADNNYMHVYNEAVAGSTIRTTKTLNILKQINESTITEPDFILINGLTNDAYTEVIQEQLGTITSDFTSTLDTTTFCGSFEATLKAAKEKWPNAQIIFVTTHKNGNRNYDAQNTLTELAIEMCEKWSIPVADVYHNSGLDSFNEEHMNTYINDGSHPNTLGYKKFYVPIIEAKIKEVLN